MTVPRGAPCTIPDCGKPVVGRGWCGRHYSIWRTHGDPLHQTRRYVKQGEACEVDDCEEPPKTYGLCAKHLSRFRRTGETTDPRQRRFWASVDRHGEDECWEWTGRRQANGYGAFGNRGTRLVHRIAYQWLVGPIPAGLVLDHLCHTGDPDCEDNERCPHRRCVNPAHLEPVTYRENIRRGNQGAYWGYVPTQIKRVAEPEPALLCAQCGLKPPYKRDICRPCYRRWLKDPTVERPSQRTPEQRFWLKVAKAGPAGCWLWTASVNPKTGYGQFARRHGEPVDAHRFSYELAHGPIPEKHDIHHTCHVRHCVNPAHLEAVTRSENLRLRKVRRA